MVNNSSIDIYYHVLYIDIKLLKNNLWRSNCFSYLDRFIFVDIFWLETPKNEAFILFYIRNIFKECNFISSDQTQTLSPYSQKYIGSICETMQPSVFCSILYYLLAHVYRLTNRRCIHFIIVYQIKSINPCIRVA